MASITHSSFFNLPEDGNLGFRFPQSNPQFDWRSNPCIVPCRTLVLNRIREYLALHASGEFTQETARLAAVLELQLFNEATSKNHYMDQEFFFDRLQKLIAQSWLKTSSSQQESMCATTSSPIYASGPTHGMLKNNLSTNCYESVHDQIMSPKTGCNVAIAPNRLADVPKSIVYGLQKCILDTNSQQFQLVLPNNRSSWVGLSNAETADSGTTYSGSVLQYDSEASFGSHCDKSQSSAGEINFVVSGDQNSPSVHTPIMAGEKLKDEDPIVSDEVHKQQLVLERMQFGQQLSHLESCCDEQFGKNKYLGTLSVQQRNLSASQGATLTSSNIQQDYVTKFLCFYIYYNNQHREGHKAPFMEYLHLLICKGGICRCEKYKAVVSHYDNCGSADCSTCWPAMKYCTANGIIQSGLRKERNDCKRSACGDICSRAYVLEGCMNPAKSRKLNTSHRSGSSCDVSGLTEEPISPSGPLSFEQSSVLGTMDSGDKVEAPTSHNDDALRLSTDYSFVDDVPGFKAVDITSSCEDPSAHVQQVKRVFSHIDDAARMSGKDTHGQEINSSDATKCLDDPSAKFCQEIVPAVSEHIDKVPDSFCELPSDSVPNSCKNKSIAQNVDLVLGNDREQTQGKASEEGFPSVAGSRTGMKSEKQKVDGISLIDFFTHEEIKQHMSSLKQKEDQGLAEEIVGNEASCSSSLCQLCGLDKPLAFSPMPIYCSYCTARIKNRATYYSTSNENSDHCFCTSCYNKCHRGHFILHGLSIPKTNLAAKKNDLVTVEPWVQCDRCEGWQHQICGLYIDKKDFGGNAEYICPKCYLKDIEFGGHIPLPRSTSLDAINLPQTLLSNHLERRLYRRLKQEREHRAKAAGKKPEEVPQPADLVIRVVSSVDKILKVKQQFLDIFPDKSYPAEFPYRSKVILLFQRIEGVDVCLFAMYVQEFGSTCSQPNQRCVYISYLDSVKYFRPDAKTAKGEALRTFVYHEILVGYLDYCKKRGFATCYIWACPPVKGEDYILYCHPETQKTPKPDKLRLWYNFLFHSPSPKHESMYQSMLKKATEEKIVVNFSNLYEKFFVHTEECNTKVTAARLPYFDGDYWSSVVENMIKKIEQETEGDLQTRVQKLGRRTLRSMGHISPSADDAKDILLMQALGQNISSAKEDFIIVYLQYVCTHCHEVILSGQRWFCSRCKNYQLCGRCHDVGEQSGSGNTHISSGGQRHALSQETVTDVPVNTEDNDTIMDNCFLENRHALLSFCQGKHYQFDSLRRAKHSSMMILYHLHNPNGICSVCVKDAGAHSSWICERCPEFSVCCSCYLRKGASCHSHPLTEYLPSATTGTETKITRMVRQLLDVLLHASQCQTPISHCLYPNCVGLRKLFSHARKCKTRVHGGCPPCRRVWFILRVHYQWCEDSNCGVPRCILSLSKENRLPDICSHLMS
ncbi:Histone acetyltransferase HAC1 [Bienertia sinuspersici]